MQLAELPQCLCLPQVSCLQSHGLTLARCAGVWPDEPAVQVSIPSLRLIQAAQCASDGGHMLIPLSGMQIGVCPGQT